MDGAGNSSTDVEISWAQEAASFEVSFLWVYLASAKWKFSVALIWFRDCLIRRGCSHLLHRWRALRVTDAARRPWARLHLLPRDLRLQRSADGEVCTGPHLLRRLARAPPLHTGPRHAFRVQSRLSQLRHVHGSLVRLLSGFREVPFRTSRTLFRVRWTDGRTMHPLPPAQKRRHVEVVVARDFGQSCLQGPDELWRTWAVIAAQTSRTCSRARMRRMVLAGSWTYRGMTLPWWRRRGQWPGVRHYSLRRSSNLA